MPRRSFAGGARYLAVREDLRCKIAEGRIPPGKPLPGRRELARRYGVAVNTVNRAVEELAREGLVEVQDRRGTFAARREGEAKAAQHGIAPALAKTRPRPAERPAAPAEFGVVAATDIASRDPSNWTLAVLDAIERVVSSAGGRVRFYNVYYAAPRTFDSPGKALDAAMADGVDCAAVVSVNAYPRWEEDVARAAARARVPVVCVWYTAMQAALPHVFMDQREAGRLAAEHLLASGYRKVLFLAPYTADWVEERASGARAAVLERGLGPGSFLRHPGRPVWHYFDFGKATGPRRDRVVADMIRAGARRAGLESCEGGTWGAIASTDMEARVAVEVFERMGLEVGRDVGLVGFDDSVESRLKGISSLRPPLEELGEMAARLLLSALAGEALPVRTSLRPHLHARSSTSRPAPAEAAIPTTARGY